MNDQRLDLHDARPPATGTHNMAKELLGPPLRFVVCLLLLKLFFLDWLRWTFMGGPLTDGREIVRPLDGISAPPRPVAEPEGSSKPDDPWVRPGEQLIVAPDAPEGSYPMVRGAGGRLYQLTPGGGRHPVDSIDVPGRLSGDGVERRLLKKDADGRVTPDVGRRWVP